ncbi:HAD family hydrolase [Actinoplanes solisilvae]|uniref:HAD family hydrolase n=1 Tax=Actinoplanes solisilvae TaxID=2486853 RepID=UPI000FDBE26C|nr:HAD family hydrolase [Actinoplanes solisilvae]
MPLLFADLDNTLIDRDAAFRTAVTAFLAVHDQPRTDLAWVMEIDGSGHAPRDVVAAALTSRYPHLSPAIGTLLDNGGAEHATLSVATENALREARAAGWTCVIVTNGRTVQQEAKIYRTGLDRLVHGWVVSESAGHRKPDPQIFHLAADLALRDVHSVRPVTSRSEWTSGDWLIGDSPQADIAAAVTLGLPSVWIANGRRWPETAFHPTHITPDVAAAIHHVIRSNSTHR